MMPGSNTALDVGGGGDPREFPAAWTLDDISLGGGIAFDEGPGTPTGMTKVGTFDVESMPGVDLEIGAGEHLYIADPGGDIR